MSSTAPVPVVIIGFKPMIRGTLRGFVDLRLGASLIIRGCTLLTSHDRAWIGLPGKPQLGADGTVQKDDKGKIKYAPILEWADRAAGERFNVAVLDALRITYPDCLAEGGGE
jgi:hypothetical protein